MRTLTDHKQNGCNDHLTVTVIDDPGIGGASHHYVIGGYHRNVKQGGQIYAQIESDIVFQNGPINEKGVNGLTQEALIAICIDRLRSFQGGQYACRENAIALTKLEEALMWLQKRTSDRLKRGVEGTHQK